MAVAEIMEKQKPSRVQEVAKRVFRHENAVLGIILASLVGVFGVLSKGYAVTAYNVMNVILQSSMRGLAAIGQAFVILTAGIDISVGGMALVTLSLAAVLMTGRAGLTAGPIALMFLLGMTIGASTGLSVSRINIPPLIVTLAVWGILRGASMQITKGYTITGLPPSVAFFASGRIAGVPVPVIIFTVACVVAYFVLNHTSFGRSVYTVGGNPTSAWLSGINVKNIRFSVYVISGFCATLAGLVIMSRTMSAAMGSVYGLELDSIASVVIGGVSLMGGRGNIAGVAIGAVMIGVINNGMSIMAASPAVQDIVKGAVIIIAVAIDYIRRR